MGQVEGIAHARSARRRTSCGIKDSLWSPNIRAMRPKVSKAWQSLDRREVGEFVENIEQFARERPVAFIGGAMVAGSRLPFMKSSSARHNRPSERSYEPRPATHGAAEAPPGPRRRPGCGRRIRPHPVRAVEARAARESCHATL